MKILFLGRNDDQCMGSGLYYIRKELENHAIIIPCGRGWEPERDISKIMRMYNPDVILHDGRLMNFDYWTNLDKTTMPKAMFYGDPETHVEARTDYINKNKIDLSLHFCNRVYNSPTISERVVDIFSEHKAVWLPWSVPSSIFKDYGYEREYDLGCLGRVYWLYPLRLKAWREFGAISQRDGTFNDSKGLKIFYKDRPRSNWGWTEGTALMRGSYAEAISRCKAMVFDGSRYGLAVMKYFECLGTNTLAIARRPGDADELGFIDGETYVEINEDNLVEKIMYYIENDDERRRISLNGYKLVRERHTTELRASQLYGILEELVENH